MPITFDQTLVVGVSSRALFDLDEANEVFEEEGIAAYRQYMVARELEPLLPGTAFPLAQALLALNKFATDGQPALAEVIVMSANSPETGARIMNSLRHYKLASTRSAFTGGESISDFAEAFQLDLFLSFSERDVQRVVDGKYCAAARLYAPPSGYEPPQDQVRIAFDADAVLFDDSSEQLYRSQGLDGFHANENSSRSQPMLDGPFAKFIKKLALVQSRLPDPVEYSPIRLSVVTARNAPAELRVIATLRAWNVYLDAAFFLGGIEKSGVLKALRPHIFFDDQDAHVLPASRHVPSGIVPYHSDSPLASSNPGASQPETRSDSEISHRRSPAD